MPGYNTNRIVAVEEDSSVVMMEDGGGGGDDEDEDVIPGPPSSPSTTPGSPISNRSLLSRVLNVSSGSNKNKHRERSAGGRSSIASSGASGASNSGDELQLSNTEHKHNWSGMGILACRDDLELDPVTFAAGCNLLQAAARGDVESMRVLLYDSHKTHVNFRDYDRRTALHVAASEGHLNTVKFLINEAGAKVNRSDRWGGSPLDDANRHRHTEVVEFLRQHGAATGSGNRLTNLIKAAADGDLDEVQTLLTFLQRHKKSSITTTGAGAAAAGGDVNSSLTSFDINQGDYDKRTALHLAAGEGHVDIVRALCQAGADVNVEDRWHRRPLDDAIVGNHRDVIELLESYGAARGRNVIDEQQQQRASHNEEDGLHGSLDRSTKRAVDNMKIEFEELQMIDRIGSGAFGEIYKCRWRGTLVAVKIIKSAKIRRDWTNRRIAEAIERGKDVDEAIRELDQAELDVDEKDLAIADFQQEISVLKSLRHPHIVLLLAYSTTENYECLISELMKCSLLDVFKSHLVQGTRMPRRTQIMYATQLAQGMNYLHTCKPPIIHRDLKPANLLIDFSGVLKISDFGLSKIRPDPEKNETEIFTMTGETGSYRFMAPEVFRHEDYNQNVDIYSYGMILFYLLVGRPPWPTLAGVDAVRKASEEGDRPVIPRDLDQRLQSLLKECWDENPNARPSFSTILDVLAKYSQDAFHTNSNDVLTSTSSDNAKFSCCVIQ